MLDSIGFPEQDSLIINGTPSLQNIGFIALGVRSRKEHYNNFEDEIWVDELRVSDIYKDPGVAGEIAASLKVADLFTLSGSYNEQDADFHNVNTRTADQNYVEDARFAQCFNVAKIRSRTVRLRAAVRGERQLHRNLKPRPNTFRIPTRVLNQENPDTTVVRHEELMTRTRRATPSPATRPIRSCAGRLKNSG